jgi:hypothetical protein
MLGGFPLIKSIQFQASLADRQWKDPPEAAFRVFLFSLLINKALRDIMREKGELLLNTDKWLVSVDKARRRLYY